MTASASGRPLQPVVVIGAARSGTRILRDALALAGGAGRVPYDVGYVWRYRNQSRPDDALPPELATPPVRRYVRGFLGRYAADDGRLVEKTVGNALRVGYVERVLPEAAYVHLVRDGVAVTRSAHRQWQAPADLRYLARKARHFPARLAPTYGRRYLTAQLSAQVSTRLGRGPTRASWGPRYPGIDADLAGSDLLAVCARQWRACVEASRRDLAAVAAPVVEVRYEELVASPEAVLRRASELAGLRATRTGLREAAALVHAAGGDDRAGLTVPERATLRHEVGDLLEELGYARP